MLEGPLEAQTFAPGLILFIAKIYTVDPASSTAEAAAIANAIKGVSVWYVRPRASLSTRVAVVRKILRISPARCRK